MNIDWDNSEVRIISAGRGRWRKKTLSDPSWSGRTPDNDLWVIWAGGGRARTRGGKVTLRPGTVLWMKPGWTYSVTQDPENTLGMDFIHFSLLDKHGKNISVTSETVPDQLMTFDPFFAQSVTRHIVELLYFGDLRKIRPYNLKPDLISHSIMVNCSDAGERSPAIISSASLLLKALLSDLANSNPQNERAPENGIELHHRWTAMRASILMRENTAAAADVRGFAQKAGYSVDHFTRIFKKVFGIPPLEYLIDLRIKKAAQMLAGTSLGVSQIAAELGYRDKYFFSSQFKAKTGLSPREFRRRNSGGAAAI
jgi:AraC-like DNA-binding protein